MGIKFKSFWVFKSDIKKINIKPKPADKTLRFKGRKGLKIWIISIEVYQPSDDLKDISKALKFSLSKNKLS